MRNKKRPAADTPGCRPINQEIAAGLQGNTHPHPRAYKKSVKFREWEVTRPLPNQKVLRAPLFHPSEAPTMAEFPSLPWLVNMHGIQLSLPHVTREAQP